jgi:predicted DNA-binding protein with PD1-like motif
VYIYFGPKNGDPDEMNRKAKITSVLSVVLASGMAFTAPYRLSGQQPSAAPEASHAVKSGNAPGLKVTDLGRSGRTYRVNMIKGDEIMSGLMEFAEKNHIRNGHFTGLGAIDQGVLQWADPIHKGHKTTEVNEEAEIVSLVGSIGLDKDGKPTVHAHMAVALSDGSTRGGHLVEARVSIICQVFVVEEEDAATNASR